MNFQTKKQRRKERRQSQDSAQGDDAGDADDKPQPPVEESFDEDSCRQRIVNVMKEALTPPGEPDINIQLTQLPASSSIDAR